MAGPSGVTATGIAGWTTGTIYAPVSDTCPFAALKMRWPVPAAPTSYPTGILRDESAGTVMLLASGPVQVMGPVVQQVSVTVCEVDPLFVIVKSSL